MFWILVLKWFFVVSLEILGMGLGQLILIFIWLVFSVLALHGAPSPGQAEKNVGKYLLLYGLLMTVVGILGAWSVFALVS